MLEEVVYLLVKTNCSEKYPALFQNFSHVSKPEFLLSGSEVETVLLFCQDMHINFNFGKP